MSFDSKWLNCVRLRTKPWHRSRLDNVSNAKLTIMPIACARLLNFLLIVFICIGPKREHGRKHVTPSCWSSKQPYTIITFNFKCKINMLYLRFDETDGGKKANRMKDDLSTTGYWWFDRVSYAVINNVHNSYDATLSLRFWTDCCSSPITLRVRHACCSVRVSPHIVIITYYRCIRYILYTRDKTDRRAYEYGGSDDDRRETTVADQKKYITRAKDAGSLQGTPLGGREGGGRSETVIVRQTIWRLSSRGEHDGRTFFSTVQIAPESHR